MTEQELLKLSKQDYYNLCVRSAVDGTFPSVGDAEDCYYRLDQTPLCKQRCIAGLLLPDEKYETGLEGVSADNNTVHKRLIFPPGVSIDDLIVLQGGHDNYRLKGEWDAIGFIRYLNKCRCFKDVDQVDPKSFVEITL